jgi:hypothetical protein
MDAVSQPQVAPHGPETALYRVFRGGCWSGDAASCRTARRGAIDPTYRAPSIGFRLALSLHGEIFSLERTMNTDEKTGPSAQDRIGEK